MQLGLAALVLLGNEALGVGARSLPPAASFGEYISFFGRDYHEGSAEYAQRLSLFQERASTALAQNAMPGATWTAALNKFADRTEAELKPLRGWRPSGRVMSRPGLGFLQSSKDLNATRAGIPTTTDWSHLQTFRQSVDQGGCGSCWAFATVAVLNAHYEILTGQLMDFSAQQLVNCVPNPEECGGSGGCKGATVELALDYVHHIGIGQLASTEQVPYSATDGSCDNAENLMALSANLRGVKQHYTFGTAAELAGFDALPMNQLLPLMEALVRGPVAVSAAANTWSSYSTGIFNSCTDWTIDHAVVAVGFGENNGHPYFRIKNSWGPDWGESGYIRIVRTPVGEEVQCGTDLHPEMGVECKPYPDTVTACGACGVLYDNVAPTILAARLHP